MWGGEIFGTPPEPHFNLPSGALSPELLHEWLGILATENAENITSTMKRKGTFKSNECASDFFQLCERLKLPPEAKYLGIELFDRFMVRHIKDLHEHAMTAAPQVRQQEWNTILERVYKQIHLRMVSCCQVASKLISHYKIITPKKAQAVLAEMGHVYSCESVLHSEIRVMKTLRFKLNAGHPLLYIETILEILGYNNSTKDVKIIHGVCLDLLDIMYLRYNLIYDRLFQLLVDNMQSSKLDRGNFGAIEHDFMLMAVAVICGAAYMVKRHNMDQVIRDLAQITQISTEDILDFSSILIQVVLDGDDCSRLQPSAPRHTGS